MRTSVVTTLTLCLLVAVPAETRAGGLGKAAQEAAEFLLKKFGKKSGRRRSGPARCPHCVGSVAARRRRAERRPQGRPQGAPPGRRGG